MEGEGGDFFRGKTFEKNTPGSPRGAVLGGWGFLVFFLVFFGGLLKWLNHGSGVKNCPK